MRPRMYGSTDMNSLRTSSSPSPGSGTSASARRKSLSRGSPCGRAASRISRLDVGISVSIPTLSTTRADPVAAAEQLAATAAELASEGERERRLPAPLVAELAEAGLFRLCVPSALGGLEAHPATLVRAVEALARGDGAAGWCVAIAATSGLVGGYLPDDAARDIYGRSTSIAGGGVRPEGPRGAGGRRVPGERALALRQRLHALRLAHGRLRRPRRRRAPHAAQRHARRAPHARPGGGLHHPRHLARRR